MVSFIYDEKEEFGYISVSCDDDMMMICEDFIAFKNPLGAGLV